jgi:hypothetical protein
MKDRGIEKEICQVVRAFWFVARFMIYGAILIITYPKTHEKRGTARSAMVVTENDRDCVHP